ncbi:MAG: nickel pincer cofactor biosynthesis protein LarC [Candidatus Magnetominusculus sp. LBB02]|nr:nickel pincer cofactor biosynthesis protein LarC [Candidatus Magnetominusculus sp. LBB02]
MKIAYIQCASGVSGDMLVGAAIDAGASIEYLRERLSGLLRPTDAAPPLEAFTITSEPVFKGGFRAVKFDVKTSESHVQRNWQEIKAIIEAAGFDDDIKAQGLTIFQSIFEAEAEAHGEPFELIHLHELGGADCLVDVFGFLLSMSYLGIKKIVCSSINVGGGSVISAHGMLPVPAPATAHLLKGLPVYSSGVNYELATPTGAAIMKAMASELGPLPEMAVDVIGTGAGGRDIAGAPNILRMFIGRTASIGGNAQADDVFIVETNIDDMSPELYGYVMDKLFQAGALDVYITPIIMKKCRPAAMLTTIAAPGDIEPLTQIILQETSSIGLRYYSTRRKTLQRHIGKISTKYGEISIKTAVKDGKILNISAEYEDCRRAAEQFAVPIKTVINEALARANDS